MINKIVLVIGSAPNAFLPKIIPYKIYAANGAAQRALIYKKRSSKTYFISITGKAGPKLELVRSKIEKLEPDEIITINGKVKLERYFTKKFLNKIKYRFLLKKAFSLQKKIYSINVLRMSDIGLIFGSGNIFFGIFKLFYTFFIKKRRPMGLTTGGLSILIALVENPTSEVIVTGIGAKGGKHFYSYKKRVVGQKESFPDYRGRSDLFLLKRLPIKLKCRLITTDVDFSKKVGIKLLKKYEKI